MELWLRRKPCVGDHTPGSLYVDGDFECFTLEDEFRLTKVPGKTRIPAGRFRIRLRTDSPMSDRYAARFPNMHRGMLWLQDVPDFEYVYLHIGNDDEDTDGCPLVGQGYENGRLIASTPAYIALYQLVIKAMDEGHDVWITVENDPTDVPVDMPSEGRMQS